MQTITFIPTLDLSNNLIRFTFTPTSSAGLVITYTSSNNSIAIITDNIATIIGNGACLITCSQEGNVSINPAQTIFQNLNVYTNSRIIMFDSFTSTNTPEQNIPFYLADDPNSNMEVVYSYPHTFISTIYWKRYLFNNISFQ